MLILLIKLLLLLFGLFFLKVFLKLSNFNLNLNVSYLSTCDTGSWRPRRILLSSPSFSPNGGLSTTDAWRDLKTKRPSVFGLVVFWQNDGRHNNARQQARSSPQRRLTDSPLGRRQLTRLAGSPAYSLARSLACCHRPAGRLDATTICNRREKLAGPGSTGERASVSFAGRHACVRVSVGCCCWCAESALASRPASSSNWAARRKVQPPVSLHSVRLNCGQPLRRLASEREAGRLQLALGRLLARERPTTQPRRPTTTTQAKLRDSNTRLASLSRRRKRRPRPRPRRVAAPLGHLPCWRPPRGRPMRRAESRVVVVVTLALTSTPLWCSRRRGLAPSASASALTAASNEAAQLQLMNSARERAREQAGRRLAPSSFVLLPSLRSRRREQESRPARLPVATEAARAGARPG